MSDCDREASIIRRPWPAEGYCAVKKKKANLIITGCLCQVVDCYCAEVCLDRSREILTPWASFLILTSFII